MKALAVLLVVVLAAAAHHTSGTNDGPAEPAAPAAAVPVDADPADPTATKSRGTYEGELFTYCDGQGHAFGVQPDTADARAAAEAKCAHIDGATNGAPWPEGWRP